MDGEPFPPPPATDNDGQRFYLKRLMKWAENAGVKVDKLSRICYQYYMFDLNYPGIFLVYMILLTYTTKMLVIGAD